jgi:hypothetical protein
MNADPDATLTFFTYLIALATETGTFCAQLSVLWILFSIQCSDFTPPIE